jgi:ubiquinone/menaquinone biosynthesis C-methylase UbiE
MGMEGAVARWYDRNTRKSMDDFRELAERLAGKAPAGSRVLEVAPGPGFLSIEMARRSLHVTALDISRTFVEIARENALREGVEVDFRLGNASEMPFESASFDFAVCRAAFKNFSEPVKALREMHRVLRPGGWALVIDLSRDVPMSAIQEYVERTGMSWFSRWMTRLTFRFMLLKRAYTKTDLERMLAATAFTRTEIRDGGLGFEAWLTK